MSDAELEPHTLRVLRTPEEEIWPEFEARYDVLDSPRDFLLVGRQGSPDIDGQPLAISIATMNQNNASNVETSALQPVRANGARFLLAHESLVAPMRRFLSQQTRAAQLANLEKKSVRMIVELGLSKHLGIIAAHILFPSTEGDQISSMLFVPRRIAQARGTVGTVGRYNRWRNLDIDLTGLIEQEQAGIATNLRLDYSVEARALAAVGMLANQQMIKRSVEQYQDTPVIESGTMLREE